MRRVCTSATPALAVVGTLVGAGSASAASGSPAAFRYTIHLPPGKFISVQYAHLDAVRSEPPGSHLVLAFQAPNFY
jgi:hypothetical protein